MNPFTAILFNTIRENYRNRFFVVTFVLAIIIFFFSILLGELSFEERQKILFDLGTSGIHWVMLVMAIFMGSFTLQKELERQTYMTLLASPLSRTEFLLGKFFGLWALMKMTLIILAIILYFLIGKIPFLSFSCVIYGILLEGLVLLASSFLFALLFSPTVGLLCSFSFFIIGNWLEDLHFFADRSNDEIYKTFAKIMDLVIPHFYASNWRYFYLLNQGIELKRVLLVSMHFLIWTTLLMALAQFSFQRKVLS